MTTDDGQIYVCLGLVKRNMDKFMGTGERVLFGALAVDISPGVLADCDVSIAV
jgi:hypothetical protein